MEDAKNFEKISKMNLLELNYNLRNKKLSDVDMLYFWKDATDKIYCSKPEDISVREENLNLLEKTITMFYYFTPKTVGIEDFKFINDYMNIYISYKSFFTNSSFDDVLEDLGDVIKNLEKRAEKLSKSFFKFFDFYVIVLTIAALGIIGSVLMPNLLGFFPTVLGGMLVFLFLFLLFRGRFIGAFLVPGMIIFLADFIEKYIPKESMLTIGLLVFIGSIVLLVIRLVFKKLVKSGKITTVKQKKINKLHTELSFIKDNVETFLYVFNFSIKEMIESYHQRGLSEDVIKKDVMFFVESIRKNGFFDLYTNVTDKVSAYYEYVLERLNKIEINEE